MSKKQDRSAAAKKGWESRRRRERENYEFAIQKIQSIKPDDIRTLSKSELLDIAQKGARAVKFREQEFRKKFRAETGSHKKFDFNRENFDVNDETSMGRLRHVLRMEQKFLARRNTYDEFVEQANAFERRIRARANADVSHMTGEEIGELESSQEVELTLAEQIRLRSRFFDLYQKALELHFGGSEPSKGSPIYALVSEAILDNPNMTERDLFNLVEGWYGAERASRNEQSRIQGTDTSKFIKVSFDNNR